MVADLSQHELDHRPDPQKWSIGEVLDHLVLFDSFLSRDIAQPIDRAKIGKPTVIRHSLGDVNVAPAFLPKSLLPLFEIPFSLTSAFVPSRVRDAIVRIRLLRFQHPGVADSCHGRSGGELRQELCESFQIIEDLLHDNAALEFRKLHI